MMLPIQVCRQNVEERRHVTTFLRAVQQIQLRLIPELPWNTHCSFMPKRIISMRRIP